jgi:hypothetical protein
MPKGGTCKTCKSPSLIFTAPWWTKFGARLKILDLPTLVLTLLPKGLLIFSKADTRF